jgi:hypothetical protein
MAVWMGLPDAFSVDWSKLSPQETATLPEKLTGGVTIKLAVQGRRPIQAQDLPEMVSPLLGDLTSPISSLTW